MCPAVFFHVEHKESGNLLTRDYAIAINTPTHNSLTILFVVVIFVLALGSIL
jgi:hypothetical protein